MTTHRNYFEIEANSNFELGGHKGELFGRYLRDTLDERRADRDWKSDVERAKAYLRYTADAFPHLVEELRGYAKSARVSFEELWLLSLEDELAVVTQDKCTTIVTNHGALIAHNEDWENDAEDGVCVIRRKLGDLHVLELYYLNTLGGNAISVNSHGFVHAVNSLPHSDHQIGIPKNVVGRWLSETSSPDNDFQRLTKLRRASGFHHTLVSFDGRIWSIECSAKRQVLTQPKPPFVHTNHYLTKLSTLEDDDEDAGVPGTRTRYKAAEEKVHDPMSDDAMRGLVSDKSAGRSRSIFNDRTVARMIIDTRQMVANVWLLREDDKGWISYNIDLVRN